jgi:apolipoprotein N-acyltransferase
VGLAWLALTVAFEFGFGHYAAGHSWSELLADYDPTSGRVWILIPLWVALAPYLFYRLER